MRITVLKLIRKSRRNLYIVFFITLFLWFTFYDFYTENDFNVFLNIVRSIVFVLIYAFFLQILNSKDNNEKEG
jgi:hypothetical protein